MRIDRLKLINFKNLSHLSIDFQPGINLFVGANGSGKTSILEAVSTAVKPFLNLRDIRFEHLKMMGKYSLTNLLHF